ncbi:MAG: hypothetical protein F4203_08385 [Rhodobacteraceae bacterium]|nr:hypothetical protein [Paracoccaceae bacterium]
MILYFLCNRHDSRLFMSGWIFSGSIPDPNQSFQAFPGLLFAEYRQQRGNPIATGQADLPVIYCNIDGFLQLPYFEHCLFPSA